MNLFINENYTQSRANRRDDLTNNPSAFELGTPAANGQAQMLAKHGSYRLDITIQDVRALSRELLAQLQECAGAGIIAQVSEKEPDRAWRLR